MSVPSLPVLAVVQYVPCAKFRTSAAELLRFTTLAFLLSSKSRSRIRPAFCALRTQCLDFSTEVSCSWTLDARLRCVLLTVLPSRRRSRFCFPRPRPFFDSLSPKAVSPRSLYFPCHHCLHAPSSLPRFQSRIHPDKRMGFMAFCPIIPSLFAYYNWSCSPNGKIEPLHYVP
jgi:hypothetical protein